ncbi:hypothetical protein [Collimonas arenae]|uniref:hypothetical protein n=1 Tax=Collimonas arenae TaxID=279058 RepID=UPI00056F791C|nr:hypothetical protein [Collimonas arenae]
MSWDISISKFSKKYTSIADIPDDEKPLEIGSLSIVHEAVLKVFRGTSWADPSWGIWDSQAGSIEFNLGHVDPASGIMLHVRTNAEVIPLIVKLCLDNGWQGIDCSSGDFIEQSEEPANGLQSWAAYRDQVIRGGSA